MNKFFSFLKRKGHGISILIPFRSSDKYSRQTQNFKWLKKYWKHQLPGAQIIVGVDPDLDRTFSKSVAVNDAASRATGDILAIVDADGYISAETVLFCANEIRRAREDGHRLWYVPYNRFYRLMDEASQRVLDSNPKHPYMPSFIPKMRDIQTIFASGHGHWYGAMIQILPREAYDIVGGWDERFRGWGGEDHSIMRATDTLYWRHKIIKGPVFHLWHPMLSKEGTDTWVEWSKRLWDNQEKSGNNSTLAARYSKANGDIKKMRQIVDEARTQENK